MNPMPESASRRPPGHFRGLLESIAQYFKARLTLLIIEAKSAGIQYGAGVALGTGGLFVAVLGYVFLVITAVFGIAAFWDWRYAWIVVLGVAALLHLGGAVALILLAVRKFKGGAFETTIEEIKKDRAWLKQPTNKS
jgi:uncharacterized membrane protein YqjE